MRFRLLAVVASLWMSVVVADSESGFEQGGFEPDSLESRLQCGGMEPNWSVRFVGDAIRFSDHVDTNVVVKVSEVTYMAGRPLDYMRAYLDQSGNLLAVIQKERCDDTMSDHHFKWQLIFFERTGALAGRKAFYGCCREVAQ